MSHIEIELAHQLQQWDLVIESHQLADLLNDASQFIRILDVTRPNVYEQVHLPQAYWIDPRQLVQADEDGASGRLPDLEQLQSWLDTLDLTDQHHIVVYDDEGGGWAGRVIWNLHCCGLTQVHFLNGGIHAWLAAGLPTESECPQRSVSSPSSNRVRVRPEAKYVCRIEFDELLAHLDASDTVNSSSSMQLWDCRSYEEYQGIRLAARRGGHIPRAIWYEWTELFDRQQHLRLYPPSILRQRLAAHGIDGTCAVVVYCQSHHRSGLAYLVARLLGWNVRAYDGGWSEWGNRSDSLIEMGR